MAREEDPVMRKEEDGKKEWKRRDGRNRAEPVALNRMVVRRGRAARVCRLVV